MAEHKKLRASYEELHNTINAIIADLQRLGQMVNNLQRAIAQNAEVLTATISLLGEDSVEHELNRLRKERQEAVEVQQVANVKSLIDAKVLVLAEVVAENSFIIGQDVMNDGATRRFQFEVSTVPEADRKNYIGLKVGGQFKTERGTMNVTEIYTVDQARATEYAEEQQKAAATAAAASETAKTDATPAAKVAPSEPQSASEPTPAQPEPTPAQ